MRYNIAMRKEPRYMGLRALMKTGNIVSPHFSYHVLPFEIDVFDKDAFEADPTDFWMVCTDVLTGEPVYHKMSEFNHHEMEWCRATASMPAVSTPVEVDGMTLLDGGMVDAIPLKKFQEITDPVDAIEVDVSDMAYVSSAGLRVLLIMYKSLSDKGRFKLSGVRKEVQEILETTGFDQFFM